MYLIFFSFISVLDKHQENFTSRMFSFSLEYYKFNTSWNQKMFPGKLCNRCLTEINRDFNLGPD